MVDSNIPSFQYSFRSSDPRPLMPQTLQRQPAVVSVLNRLLRLLCRSLPAYLEHAKPCGTDVHPKQWAVLSHLVADQRLLARRVAQAAIQYGGQPDPGPFPTEFAALNDVGLDYLLRRVNDGLERDIEAIEQCAAELTHAPEARELVQEVLGNAQGHQDILCALATGAQNAAANV